MLVNVVQYLWCLIARGSNFADQLRILGSKTLRKAKVPNLYVPCWISSADEDILSDRHAQSVLN